MLFVDRISSKLAKLLQNCQFGSLKSISPINAFILLQVLDSPSFESDILRQLSDSIDLTLVLLPVFEHRVIFDGSERVRFNEEVILDFLGVRLPVFFVKTSLVFCGGLADAIDLLLVLPPVLEPSDLDFERVRFEEVILVFDFPVVRLLVFSLVKLSVVLSGGHSVLSNV